MTQILTDRDIWDTITSGTTKESDTCTNYTMMNEATSLDMRYTRQKPYERYSSRMKYSGMLCSATIFLMTCSQMEIITVWTKQEWYKVTWGNAHESSWFWRRNRWDWHPVNRGHEYEKYAEGYINSPIHVRSSMKNSIGSWDQHVARQCHRIIW